MPFLIPDRESNAGPRLPRMRCEDEVTCPTCETRSDRPEIYKCGVHGCSALMCGYCVTKCSGCNQEHCAAHLVPYDGEKLCPVCLKYQFDQMLDELKETA